MELESRLKAARDHSKLSQPGLAEKIDISPRSVAGYEKDASKIQLSLIYKIAEICSVDVVWLITGIGNMVRQSPPRELDGTVVPFGPVVENHIETIKRFKDHEKALAVNADLVFLEEHNPDAFEKALTYVKGLKDGTPSTVIGDRRKKSMPFSPDRRKKVS